MSVDKQSPAIENLPSPLNDVAGILALGTVLVAGHAVIKTYDASDPAPEPELSLHLSDTQAHAIAVLKGDKHDSDGDGLSDSVEVLLNTNPHQPDEDLGLRLNLSH